MSNLRLNAGLFFRNIFICVITASGFGYWLYRVLRNTVRIKTLGVFFENFGMESLRIGQKLAFILFIMFLFISFEFVSKAKLQNADEVIFASQNPKSNFYFGQVQFLLIIDFAIFIIATICHITPVVILNIASTELIVYIILLSALTYFLTCAAAIFIGSAIAVRLKRISGYAVLIVLAVLSSPIIPLLASTLSSSDIFIYPLVDAFKFYLVNSDWSTDIQFLYPILPYRWAFSIFWIAIALLFSAPKLFPRILHNKTKQATCAFLSVLLFLSGVIAFMPTSTVEMTEDPDKGFFHDYYYYVAGGADQIDCAADFSATDYDVDMRIARKLHMDVKVYVDKKDKSEYVFTLHHDYKIKEIKDSSGKNLKFDLKNDYITVYAERNIDYIEFIYSGFSPVFYSNLQGVLLTGDFAYYPMPGCKKLYDCDNQVNAPVLLDNETNFRLKVSAPYKIYTNLEKQGEIYTGKSNALTVVSGFLEEYDVDKTKIVTSYLQGSGTKEYLKTVLNEIRAFDAKSNFSYKLEEKKIFVVRVPNQGSAVGGAATDHIILRAGFFDSSYQSTVEYAEENK